MVDHVRATLLMALLFTSAYVAKADGLWATAWGRVKRGVSRFKHFPRVLGVVVKDGKLQNLYSDGTLIPMMAGGADAPFIAKDAIPDTPEGLAELLADDKQRTAVFANQETAADFLKKYNKAVNDKRPDIQRMIDDGVQKGLRSFLIDAGVNKPDVTGNIEQWEAPHKGTAYNRRAAGAALDAEFKDMPDFLYSIYHKNMVGEEKWRRIRNDYSSIDPATGGFLVPEILRSEVLRLALETAVVRSRARVIPMDSARVPFPAIDVTSHASSLFGGITAGWTEQGAAITESQGKFAQVVLEAKKLAAYCEVPNELLQDSIVSFAAFVEQVYPEAISWFEDDAFLTGTGTGEPQGVLNSPALIGVDKEGGQLAATIVWENIVNMYSRMLPSSLGRAIWVANINTFPQLATMALSVGTGGSGIWLNNGVAGPPMTILGRPVIFTQKVPTLGTVGDITFLDFGYYLVGDLQQMRADSSPHVKFQNDMTVYRVTERVDGRGWLQSALTPKAGSTLSPFVSLDTRS